MNIASLHSHKGGVGKTTVAIGVAAILSQEKGKRVCLVEADIVGAGLEYSIDITPNGKYLNHFFLPPWSKEKKLTTIEEVGAMLLDTDISNLQVISCTPMPKIKEESLILEHQESIRDELESGLGNLIESLEEDYGFDYCIFDCSPGIDGMSVSVLKTTIINNGTAIFVATPDRPHIVGLLQDLKVWQDPEEFQDIAINSEKIILVINQVPSEREKDFSNLNELSRTIKRDKILTKRRDALSPEDVITLFRNYQYILYNIQINQQFHLAGSEGRILISDIKDNTNIPLLADMIERMVNS